MRNRRSLKKHRLVNTETHLRRQTSEYILYTISPCVSTSNWPPWTGSYELHPALFYPNWYKSIRHRVLWLDFSRPASSSTRAAEEEEDDENPRVDARARSRHAACVFKWVCTRVFERVLWGKGSRTHASFLNVEPARGITSVARCVQWLALESPPIASGWNRVRIPFPTSISLGAPKWVVKSQVSSLSFFFFPSKAW